MPWLANALRQNPELALFLSLAIGFAIGRLRIRNFQIGPVLGTLLAGLLVGQVVLDVPNALKSIFFLMFMFALGYRTGPEFFNSLRSGALVQLSLILVFCLTALAVTVATARLWSFDSGTAAGLLAGAQTNTTTLGSASNAIDGLDVDDATKARLSKGVANIYAITYILGVVVVVWFVPSIGPRLMGVDIRQVCREYESKSETGIKSDTVNSVLRELTVRAYLLPAGLVGRTVGEIESHWPVGQRVVIPRIRREGSLVETDPKTKLRAGDVLLATGRSSSLTSAENPLKEEVHDSALLTVPMVGADLVLTKASLAGQTLRQVSQDIGTRGIFVAGLRRGGRELPLTSSTVIERGDVLQVTGTKTEVERVGHEIGFAVYSTSATNIMLLAATVFIGGLVGLLAVTVRGISFSLSVSVGVLLAGLLLGYLRSINPKFAQIPDASLILLDSLGLAAFTGCVGLQSAPGVISGIRDAGLPLILAAVAVALVPIVVTILVGYYVAHLNPGVLLGLCAGAGTSGPTLAALERTADSKVPTLGYGVACAAGNVLMAVWGTLLIVTGT